MLEPTPKDSELDRIRAAFLAAAGQPPGERERWLDAALAGQGELRAKVEQLLGYHDAPQPILDEQNLACAPHPQRIGRYRVLSVLGSGGIGVVYRAEQDRPKRLVALKVLQPGQLRAETLKRFALEADLLARLQHPGIAHVYEAGSFETGYGEAPFFAMELVDGESLVRFAKSRGLDVRARCELVMQVCDAVQHAHERGIVHRDLKPDNILVTEPNPGDARIKVLDFGIARVVRADVELSTLITHTGQMVGTLPYMSPEQLSGTEIDARSDVYALGAILYELLAGRVPLELDGRPLTQVVKIVTEEEPEKIGRLVPALGGDLETIVEVALAKERNRRYPSVDALAADLRRFLHDQPIVARPRTAFYQLRKFARRNRALVGGVLATLLVLVAGIVSVSIYSVQNRRLAASEHDARSDERRNRYFAEMNLAGNALASGGIARVRQLVDAWRSAGPGEVDPRGFEWHFLDAASQGSERVLDAGGVQYDVAWRSDSELASHEDAGGAVFDLATGKRLASFESSSSGFVQAAIAPDGRSFAVSREHDICVLDVPTRHVRATLHAGELLGPIVWIPGRDQLAFLDRDAAIEIWDVPGARKVTTIGDEKALAFAISPDGRRYARALLSGGVDVGEIESRTVLSRLAKDDRQMFACAFAPDGNALACGGIGRVARVFDIASGRCLGSIPHEKRIMAVAWSPDGRLVASGGHDCAVHVYDLGSGRVTLLRGHGNTVLGLAYSKDGLRLASASEDGSLRVWPREPLSPVRTESLGKRAQDEIGTARMSWARDGRLAVCMPGAIETHVIAARGGFESVAGLLDWGEDAERVVSCITAGDKAEIVVSTRDPARSARWSLAERLTLPAGLAGPCLSPGGEWLAAACLDPDGGGVWVWRPASADAARPVHRGWVSNLAWHPSGSSLALLTGEGLVLVDPQTGLSVRDRALDRATHLAWSPSGDSLAVVDSFRRIHVFAPRSSGAARILRGHTQLIRSLHWHPDGTRLASAGNDRVVKIWDVASGRETLSLPLEDDVCGVRWRRDGKALAAASADGLVTIWGTEPQAGK